MQSQRFPAVSATEITRVSGPALCVTAKRLESGQQLALTEKSMTKLSLKEYVKTESRPLLFDSPCDKHLLYRDENEIPD